jgi:hypothetical protein
MIGRFCEKPNPSTVGQSDDTINYLDKNQYFDPVMTWEAKPVGKRGRLPEYSDAAIQTCLTTKVLFGMALRQTTGFVECLLRLIGWALDGVE